MRNALLERISHVSSTNCVFVMIISFISACTFAIVSSRVFIRCTILIGSGMGSSLVDRRQVRKGLDYNVYVITTVLNRHFDILTHEIKTRLNYFEIQLAVFGLKKIYLCVHVKVPTTIVYLLFPSQLY